MKIIREPKVYIVGKQILTGGMTEFLKDHETTWDTNAPSAAEYLCESAGRLCYMSYKSPRPGGNKGYLEHILEVGHHSVTEHAVWNVIVCGISRSCSHELVRHRVGISPSQLSQRYVDESVAEYVAPDVIANNETLMNLWQETVSASHAAYVRLVELLTEKLRNTCSVCNGPANLESLPQTCARCGGKAYHGTELRKAARQAARSVLPNATETKIFLTLNARSARHFIELRASRHAEVEIRKVANRLWEVLVKEAPNLFSDYEKTDLGDGTYELTTKYEKV